MYFLRLLTLIFLKLGEPESLAAASVAMATTPTSNLSVPGRKNNHYGHGCKRG